MTEPTCPECRLAEIEVEGLCRDCYNTLVDTWHKLDVDYLT